METQLVDKIYKSGFTPEVLGGGLEINRNRRGNRLDVIQ